MRRTTMRVSRWSGWLDGTGRHLAGRVGIGDPADELLEPAAVLRPPAQRAEVERALEVVLDGGTQVEQAPAGPVLAAQRLALTLPVAAVQRDGERAPEVVVQVALVRAVAPGRAARRRRRRPTSAPPGPTGARRSTPRSPTRATAGGPASPCSCSLVRFLLPVAVSSCRAAGDGPGCSRCRRDARRARRPVCRTTSDWCRSLAPAQSGPSAPSDRPRPGSIQLVCE